MYRRLPFRILICLALSLAAIAGGFLVVPGIRHRHDGGEVAHSHSAHGHSHSHSHAHVHQDHEGDHADSANLETVVTGPSSHIHFRIFGIELTLPDFLNDGPAPLVAGGSGHQHGESPVGDVVRLPSPFSLAQLIHVTLQWAAIRCQGVQLDGPGNPFRRAVTVSDRDRGLDPPAPPIPPPQSP